MTTRWAQLRSTYRQHCRSLDTCSPYKTAPKPSSVPRIFSFLTFLDCPGDRSVLACALPCHVSKRSSYIVGKSAGLKAVLEQVQVVAPMDSTVLINGETGTGKELVARAIHKISSRSNRAFVKLNCAANLMTFGGPNSCTRQAIIDE